MRKYNFSTAQKPVSIDDLKKTCLSQKVAIILLTLSLRVSIKVEMGNSVNVHELSLRWAVARCADPAQRRSNSPPQIIKIIK